MSFYITLGDITKAETTAIVNAANTSLLGGGGVDGAIHRAAGPELLAECRELHGCKTGEARLTKGYRLKARYVIHTPGPYYSDGHHNEAALLESCYRSCLELALKHKIKDLSFPSISTGIYRFPLKEAAAIAVKTISHYPQLEVTMVCFDEKTKSAYEEAKALYEKRFYRLTKYIEIFKDMDSFGEWIYDKEHSGTAEDSIQMPYILYPECVTEFIGDVHKFMEEYRICDLHNYQDILQKYGIERKQLYTAEVSQQEEECVLAMIVTVVRGERFCDGMIGTVLAKGKLQEWLERLREID